MILLPELTSISFDFIIERKAGSVSGGRWSRVCTEGDGMPGGYAEALAMIAGGLDYLNAAASSGEISEPVLGEVLLGLEAVGARHAAARAAVLSRFDAAGCHDADGYQNSSS